MVCETILVYGIWNMVCGIWYENGIHSVFTYVLHALCSGCLQRNASIPCIIFRNQTIFTMFSYKRELKWEQWFVASLGLCLLISGYQGKILYERSTNKLIDCWNHWEVLLLTANWGKLEWNIIIYPVWSSGMSIHLAKSIHLSISVIIHLWTLAKTAAKQPKMIGFKIFKSWGWKKICLPFKRPYITNHITRTLDVLCDHHFIPRYHGTINLNISLTFTFPSVIKHQLSQLNPYVFHSTNQIELTIIQ